MLRAACCDVMLQVQRKHQLPSGDFPNLERFKQVLSDFDLSKMATM